jgi:hypothetical protein
MDRERRTGLIEIGKLVLTAAALTGVLFFTSPVHLKADEAECQHRVVKADHRLHEAVDHHGWQSKEADHARHELADAREYCWSHYHRWWDEDGQRWHTDRDWDDNHGQPH